MSRIKQVIIIRKDLNMRRGKELAQFSHGSLSFLTKPLVGKIEKGQKDVTISIDDDIVEWINNGFTKIGLCVNTEQELLNVYQMALMKGLRVSLITDKGLTEFNGVPTNTVVAIGPNKSEDIDIITGNLKLY